jgi:hypothetical protein
VNESVSPLGSADSVATIRSRAGAWISLEDSRGDVRDRDGDPLGLHLPLGAPALYSKIKRRLRRRAQHRVSPFAVRSRESP